ncbi:MAG TPA: amino acid adenylation domain-containing protein [Kofleriaceae bacterium]|nr:amino acid adenylation domain-containing protein [Kofleriaceae bacterium]
MDVGDGIVSGAPGATSAHRAVDAHTVQLPWDFTRTPATLVATERYPFPLTIPRVEGASREATREATREAAREAALIVAAFAICLHRYSGQAQIPLDVTRRGQARGLELPLAGATCRELWARAEAALGGDARPPHRAGAAIAWLDRERDTPPAADLELELWPEGRAAIAYNASLFKRSTIERLAGRLGVLLEALGARLHPDASAGDELDEPVTRLPLLAASEAAWLDAIGRGRRRELPAALVHQAIEQHAARAPDKTAVRYRDRALSYGELNRRANQLAHALAARRLGAEARVVVCVEPSLDIAIALLGIFKAGAIYIPLDPTYPAGRIRTILDDTRPHLIVSNGYLIERLALADAAPVLALDAEAAALAALPDADLGLAIEPARTAYIYYTSGTTGRPKGILASYANLVAYVDLARDRYAIDEREVIPAIARFSFSISMFELATPLVAGGTLVVLDRSHVLEPARLAETLAQVTLFHAGPSLLKHLLPYIEAHYPDRAVFAGVRHASSGGDMIPPELLEALKRIFTAAEVFVIYGCSEISCMGCTYPVPRDAKIDKTYVGRPFDDVTVRVLDAAGNMMPIGAVGEIHFAGAGIVKGYLERPELTAEKFVELGGERFYRTGDMGRIGEDGWLEILGRNDFQIKIRGMRIELGEVEYNLRRAPGVRDAVVMAKPGPGGDKIMVGYVVFGDAAGDPGAPGTGTSTSAARLAAVRRHMVDHLPDYMVPAAYMELASLPVNHNLKVDRHALPDPVFAAERAVAAPHVRAPETDTERRLAAIWQDLLGMPRAGLDDNFFELGADSLLAMKLMVRAEHELGVALEGMDVLRESLEVIAGICDRLRGAPVAKAAARPAAPAGPAVETFYFGGLYGVLHGGPSAPEAVLICPPIGQEQVRAQFILTRVARQLAARGTPVLQFDYYGLGDSAGDSIDASPARWQRDVAAARAELVRRTGAGTIIALGVRFGATLLTTAGIEAARLVLWDPVYLGADWYGEQAALHQRYLRGQQDLRRGRLPARIPGAEELLGVTYAEHARRELERLVIPRTAAAPLRWLATFEPARQEARHRELAVGGGRFESLEIDCGWRDIARFEDIIPDLHVARALVAMVTEP